MQCERAQDVFSDYLEQTVARPLAVAIESHLAECSGCRSEMETLRTTFEALGSVPEVEPPADGAWQVMRELQRLRAEQWEVQRARSSGSFLDRLRALNPFSVAMGAGLATLVFGGSFLFTGGPQYIGNRFFPAGPSAVAHSVSVPSIQVGYGPVTASGQQLDLRLVTPRDVPGARMQVSGDVAMQLTGHGDISRSSGYAFSVQAPVDLPAAVVRVQLAAGQARAYRFLVVAPVADRQPKQVSLSYFDQPLDEALRRLAPYLGQPVVVDDGVSGSISLQAADESAYSALQEVAAQAHAALQNEGGFYRLTRIR